MTKNCKTVKLNCPKCGGRGTVTLNATPIPGGESLSYKCSKCGWKQDSEVFPCHHGE